MIIGVIRLKIIWLIIRMIIWMRVRMLIPTIYRDAIGDTGRLTGAVVDAGVVGLLCIIFHSLSMKFSTLIWIRRSGVVVNIIMLMENTKCIILYKFLMKELQYIFLVNEAFRSQIN